MRLNLREFTYNVYYRHLCFAVVENQYISKVGNIAHKEEAQVTSSNESSKRFSRHDEEAIFSTDAHNITI